MLSERQKELIAESWLALADDRFGVMLKFYEGLFKIAPELRYLFPENMNDMATKLDQTITVVVDNINDLPAIIPALHQLGRYHKHKVGVDAGQYKLVIQALLVAIRNAAKGLVEDQKELDEILQAWKIALIFVSKNMIAAPPKPDNKMIKFFKTLFAK